MIRRIINPVGERLGRAQSRNSHRMLREGQAGPNVSHFRTLQAQLCSFDLTHFRGRREGSLQTPFGTVNSKVGQNGQRHIYGNHSGRYVDICDTLDGFVRRVVNNGRDDLAETLIKTILKYLERPFVTGITEIGQVRQNQVHIPELTKNERGAAAMLCGILMLAESHYSRVATGGKWERAAMRATLRTKNFDWVFGVGANQGTYIPSHSQGEAMHRKSSSAQYPPSGPEQAKSIVQDQKSHFETQESFENNVELAQKLEQDLSESSNEEDIYVNCTYCKESVPMDEAFELNKNQYYCTYCHEKLFQPDEF